MKIYKLVPVAALLFSPLAFAADPGQRPYNSKCASCHGKDGRGDTEEGKKKGVKDLTAAAVQSGLTDDQIVKDITDGINEKDHEMKGFKDRLSDDEIKAVAAYVRTLKK